MLLRRTLSVFAAVILTSFASAGLQPPVDDGLGEAIELVTGQSRMVTVVQYSATVWYYGTSVSLWYYGFTGAK